MERKGRKAGEICFWIALVIELMIVIVDKSAYINPYESQLFRITFLLFGMKILTTKYSAKEWFCILLVGGIAACSYFINEKDEIVRVVVFIVSCKDISFRKNMMVIFYVTLVGCMTLILLSVTGIYGAISLTAEFGDRQIQTRYTLGMGHPNALHCMIWMLMMLGMYLYENKMKWYHFLSLFVVNILLYMLTDSNTGMIMAAVSVVSIAVLHYFPKWKNASWVYWTGAGVVLFCLIFSMIGAHIGSGWDIGNKFMERLDKILNGRYESCYRVIDARLTNWKLFASPQNQEYFDAGFVRMFYWYGIIPGTLYMAMHFYLIWQGFKQKDYVLMVMVVMFSIYSLMEAHLVSVYMLRNYLLVAMGYYWYQPFLKYMEKEGYFWQIPGLIRNED